MSPHADFDFYKRLEREWEFVRVIDVAADSSLDRWWLPRWMNKDCKLKLDGPERYEHVYLFRRRPIMQETKMTKTCCGKEVVNTVTKPLDERDKIPDEEIWKADRFRIYWENNNSVKPPHMEGA